MPNSKAVCHNFQNIYLFLGGKLFNGNKQPKNRILEMYYAATVKKHIVQNLSLDDGHIRCLITTVAFGMGVNCRKVRTIYHMGPAKNIECYIQESGRGGRDGFPAVCVLLYNGILANHCEQDIKDYCKTEICRRETLFAQFDEKPIKITPKHNCCDNCAANCSCGLGNCEVSFRLNMSNVVKLPGHLHFIERQVCTQLKVYLKSALK